MTRLPHRLGQLLLLPFVALAASGCSDDPVAPPGDVEPADPAQLAPPPAGQGFQIVTEEIEVAPGDEVQDCYFYRIRDLAALGGVDPSEPFNLHRVQIGQRVGTHHMNVFRVKTIVPDGFEDFETHPVQKGLNGNGACFKSPLWADWPLIANSQIGGSLDWTFPEGVANPLGPDEWIMVQTHYVNATTQKTPENGKVGINFWHMPASMVTSELGTIFATKQSIRICQSVPGAQTFQGGVGIDTDQDIRFIGANAHFHSRGKQFDMFLWDGKYTSDPPADSRFYTSTAWDEPPMEHSPDLEVTMPKGGGVFYECSFEWREPDPSVGCSGLNAIDKKKMMDAGKTEEEAEGALDCCYRFGGQVEPNEHCNIFVYYYPKVDDLNFF